MLDTDALVENEAAAMPTLGHGLIASRLQRALGDFVEEHGLGLVFSARTSFRVGTEPKDPDLAYVSKGRLSGLPADLDVDADFAPDLVVEIASRSDTLATISRKVRAYLDVGVGAVWVVNPWLRTVEVFRADGHHALLSEFDGEPFGADRFVRLALGAQGAILPSHERIPTIP